MSVVNAGLMLSAPSGYTIDRSLRFRSSASAYLSRTPASAGNRKTWTWSGWVKRGALGTSQVIFNADNQSGFYGAFIYFNADNTLRFQEFQATQYEATTAAVFRDCSAWYHIFVAFNTTEATAGNRLLLYVNGVSQTYTWNTTIPQNTDGVINNTKPHYLGRRVTTSGGAVNYFDGYLTEVNFIDGQALDPTYFGKYNSDTGVWQPIKYTGTYGTNGFYLNFSDNSTTTTLGYDYSGNSNNWTANNISVTSGATYDSMTDVPTLTSEDAGNYATLNPLDPPTTNFTKTGTNANLDGNITSTAAGGCGFFSTQSVSSGKWYVEVAVGTYFASGNFDCGIINAANTRTTGNGSYGAIGYAPTGYSCFTTGAYANNNTTSASGTSYVTNDVIGIAYDADNGKLWFGKNGTWMSSGDPAAGTNAAFSSIPSGEYVFGFGCASGTSGRYTNATLNFGQRPFAYTPPAGFKSLNTYNLPDSTIEDGSEYFDTVLWTGDGSQTRSITDTNFQPDMVWMKLRTGTTQVTQVYDAVRGVGGGKGLSTAEPYAEGTMNGGYLDSDYGYISSLDASGFSVNDGAVATTGGWVNYASRTYVAWNWKANGSGVTNNEGTIESTVSANPTAGFSIVTYTGTGSAATVGHGLGVAPGMIIVKNLDGVYHWAVQHTSLGATKYLTLSTNDKETTSSAPWNNTAPTSSVFSLGGSSLTNRSDNDMVAYCFASIEGYSKFGSYTGNGDADGTFVYLGFKPSLLIVKRTDTANWWNMFDSAREPTNDGVNFNYLQAESSNAENNNGASIYPALDFLSNGFKLRYNGATQNASGGTYIYMAFAENPFKNVLAR